MSYTALYRKFRPQQFEDVKGQEHIVTTLKNQIKADRIAHAYIFCGTRGTGKTTAAKIFAKAVNCEHPIDGSPCGECPMCKSIAAGTSMNVIEIDAASNNGVDNIRQICEEVTYRPTEGKYKVYIIDEVHMLTPGAYNALLKTLEEPPAYVIFILATTEVHTIPITILSRCQRYDFHRISIDTITSRLAELMETEQIEVEERALRYVAKAGDGSMRDALSLLDQCIAFHIGEKLTYENVLDVLGAVDTEVFSRLLRQIIEQDIVGAVRTIDALLDEGRELGQMVNDFTWYLRNVLLLQSADGMEEVLDMSAEHLAAMKQETEMVAPETLIRYIRIFSELSKQIRSATQKRVLLEIAIIKLCRPQMDEDYEALTQRMDELEKKVENGVVPVSSSGRGTPGVPVNTEPIEKLKLPQAVPDDIKEIIRNWKSLISEAGRLTGQFLEKAVPTLGNDGGLLLVFEDKNAYNYLNSNIAEGMDQFVQILEERTGKKTSISLKMNESGRRTEDIVPDLREMIHFDIEEEDG